MEIIENIAGLGKDRDQDPAKDLPKKQLKLSLAPKT